MSRYVYRYLDTVGDGSGTKNANGDYSSSATDFRINAPAGGVYEITRMLVHIRDAANMSADEYGNLNGALANGITVAVYDGDTLDCDLTDGLPVQSNADWGRVCYDAESLSYGSGDDFVRVRWTFSKAGQPLYLAGDYNFRVQLNDNFTGLVAHYFQVQGFYSVSTHTTTPGIYRA